MSHNANLVTPALSASVPRPPYDPLLLPQLENLKKSMPEILDLESLRQTANNYSATSVLEKHPHLEHVEHVLKGLDENDIILSVFKPKAFQSKELPALYVIHGGGQIGGNRFSALDATIGYLGDIEAVTISVEYRLSPEYPAPAALNDSYSGLIWAVENATKLGINTSKIILCGGSGGGPITAGCTLLCRNNRKPFPCGAMLLTPMLDDRDCTISSKQFARDGPWCGTTNRMAWDLVLGSERGGPNVSELVSPARATDLAGFPPTFIDVAVCEVFRDEGVAFASQLWKCGVSAELHAWPGGYHGFDIVTPDADLSRAAISAKMSWIKRIFAI